MLGLLYPRSVVDPIREGVRSVVDPIREDVRDIETLLMSARGPEAKSLKDVRMSILDVLKSVREPFMSVVDPLNSGVDAFLRLFVEVQRSVVDPLRSVVDDDHARAFFRSSWLTWVVNLRALLPGVGVWA